MADTIFSGGFGGRYPGGVDEGRLKECERVQVFTTIFVKTPL